MLQERRSPASPDKLPSWAAEPWVKADLFFLCDTLGRGMSFAEVAGFLRRTENEVRNKAKELKCVKRRRRV
jgi:hypothetical protein